MVNEVSFLQIIEIKGKMYFLLSDLYLCTIIKPNISSERKFIARFNITNGMSLR